jgi:hypothetical protein
VVWWPADNGVGDVPEKPIENYPENKQGSEAPNLTSAYPIQKYCSSAAFHFPAVYASEGPLAKHLHNTHHPARRRMENAEIAC